MNAIAKVFEKMALLLKPVGIVLAIAAGLLFVARFAQFGSLPSDRSWLMTLVMLWVLGLALLIYWFKPGRSESDLEEAAPSAARRYGKPMQLYVTTFFLIWFGFLSFITFIVV